MTDSTTPPPPDEPKADETFTWANQAPRARASRDTTGAAATSILESVREAVDDLAERAAPSVREFSARAAELAAIAADRAAPLAKRAGEVTADASGKLATRSRSWAADPPGIDRLDRDRGEGRRTGSRIDERRRADRADLTGRFDILRR